MDAWHPTDDLEVCDSNFAHLPVRAPINDNDPNCALGGGWMNILAGAYFCEKHKPTIVVCAYGARSPYLPGDAPSESEVMSNRLLPQLARHSSFSPEIVTWERSRPTPEGSRSNTRQEIANIFWLALEQRIRKVTVLSLSVHLPRCKMFGDNWQAKRTDFGMLKVEYVGSDVFLASADPKLYGQRVEAMQKSKAHERTRALEEKGMGDFHAGRYV